MGEEGPGLRAHERGAEVQELGLTVTLDPGAVFGGVFCGLKVSEEVVQDYSCFRLGWGEFRGGAGIAE